VAACKVIVQVKIATAAMSPEIFLAFGNTGLFNDCPRCNTVTVTFQKDFSTLSHILFLQFLLTSALATARDDESDSEIFHKMISSISTCGKASIQFHNGHQEPSGCSRWVSVSCQLIAVSLTISFNFTASGSSSIYRPCSEAADSLDVGLNLDLSSIHKYRNGTK
jgi:hypothetical protein